MKLAFLALIALAVAASAVEFTSETSHTEVVNALDELHAQIAAHGVESLFVESASAAEADSAVDSQSDVEADSERRRRRGKRVQVAGPPGIGISFKWSQIDVRNFLSWLVDQDPKTGGLSAMKMTSYKGKSAKKLSRKQRALLKKLRALKRLPTAGQHGGLWWYKVDCGGACNTNSIRQVCSKYDLKPACDHTAYSDGVCVNSNYNQGRHLSYPGHALEGWQHNFFPQTHIYCGWANGGHPLQNTGSTHRWSYGESGNTVCVSSQKPRFHLIKKWRNWL